MKVVAAFQKKTVSNSDHRGILFSDRKIHHIWGAEPGLITERPSRSREVQQSMAQPLSGERPEGCNSILSDEPEGRGSRVAWDGIMKLESALSDRILEVVTKTPSCRVEDLVYHFPDLTWSQVFREVANLSRKGHLRLMLNGRGIIVKNADRGHAVL
jgi:hypothetical protein